MSPTLSRFRDLGHVLVVAAALIIASTLWGHFSRPPTTWALSEIDRLALVEPDTRHTVFSGSFIDTLVFFIDYRCAYCAVLYPSIVRKDAPYGVIVRHLVNGPHSLSAQAAIAAECAGASEKFHEYSYALFSRRDSIGRVSWQRFLELAGVADSGPILSCIEKRAPIHVINEDTELGHRLGIQGTPALIYQGHAYVGPTRITELLERLSPGTI